MALEAFCSPEPVDKIVLMLLYLYPHEAYPQRVHSKFACLLWFASCNTPTCFDVFHFDMIQLQKLITF